MRGERGRRERERDERDERERERFLSFHARPHVRTSLSLSALPNRCQIAAKSLPNTTNCITIETAKLKIMKLGRNIMKS